MKSKLIHCKTAISIVFLVIAASCGEGSKIHLLHAPVVSKSDETSTKLETIWSRVSFGHYPSREIVKESFDAVDYYAYDEDKDVLLDAALYARLEAAEWKQEKTSIYGVDYIRLLEPDATSTSQHYRYDNPGEKYHYFECQPIPWRVLALDGSKVTLMADLALDCFNYHPSDTGASWKDSYIRGYLNSLNQNGDSFLDGGFLNAAFSSKEKEALIKRTSPETVNDDYEISTGEPTEDYVYLLDQSEMYASEQAHKYGFYNGHGHDDPAKRFKSSMFAKFRGCWYSPVKGYRGNCFHFMRTVGYKPGYVSYICDFGYIYSRGTSADCFDAGIIPVINVDLDKTEWSVIDDRSSTSILQSMPSQLDESGAGDKTTWDTVEYGIYPQDEVLPDDERYASLKSAVWIVDEAEVDGIQYRRKDGRYYEYQPISWRILEKEGDFALLFASKGLDCHRYNSFLSWTNWGESSIRQYLNDEFLESVFPEEGEAILETHLENKPNHYFGTDCGNDTVDKVFLLSEDDVFGDETAKKHGFAPSDATTDEGRRIAPTDYAIARGAWTSKDGNGFYSLRNSGYSNANAVYVGELGDIYNRGIPVTCSDTTLVPAIWVDLTLI